MKFWHPFSSLMAIAGLATHSTAQSWPLHDNGLNKVVQWDHFSVKVNGQRLFLWSGELHLWRILVPELWRDIFEKIKAAGFNGISLYEHWGWHAPNNETLDFETGTHDYKHAFDIAHELGLYVVYRPGPYSNAEANGGGFPGWLTAGEYGLLRDDNAAYTKAWERYSKAVAEYVRPYLITNGGPVIMWQIENEYGNQWLDPETKKPNDTAIHYMGLLEGKTRDWDIDVPFTANNPNMWTRSWPKDYGNGGSFNPWDGPEGGCSETMGPDWVNLFYRHNLAEKVTAVNIYMAYGGTNWGNIGFPEVGTSYDYSAPIHENRLIGDKFNEGKLFGLFVRVARDFVKVNRVGNSTDYTTDEDIFTSELRNADTNAAYYVVRHQDSTSTAETKFRLKVSTEAGNLTVLTSGSITLKNRESKVLVSDFSIGASRKKITYATLEILTAVDLGDRQVVVFWAPDGEQGEFLLKGATSAKFMSGKGDKKSFTKTKNGIVANVVAGEEMSVIDFSNHVEAVVVDRRASIKGDTININGDWDEETTVEIWAPNTIRKVSFNGEKLQVTKSKYGSFIGTLPAPDITVESFTSSLPSLSHWKVSEGLPEVAADYDDSRWTDADHETTPHFVPPDTASLSFTLHTEKKAKLRAQLYVNGYQYGKTLPYISNETTFPVVPGILNYQGDNTIGLNIWAMDEAGGSMGINWKVDGIYQSGFSPLFNAEYLQPGWEDRSQYA
ncbi:glycoside hydrolase superfamily [Fusarium oxysporum f. sp. albedinis]|nr:glycoside hydrolase superfamily [Fusarium oxysporum f. sp. albedinis]